MDQESSHVVTFDLGLLLQDQMRAAKLKGAYNSLIAHTFFECETMISWPGIFSCGLIWPCTPPSK